MLSCPIVEIPLSISVSPFWHAATHEEVTSFAPLASAAVAAWRCVASIS